MKTFKVVDLGPGRASPRKWNANAPPFYFCVILIVLGIAAGVLGTPRLPVKPDAYASAQWSSHTSRPKTDGVLEKMELVTYTVEKGDTLTSIAQKFSTTAESISAINNLASPDAIDAGASISLLRNGSGTVRRVAQGDTIWNISRSYDVTVEAILGANQLENENQLVVGELLILPGAKVAPQAQIASASWRDTLTWPVTGAITSGYGWRIHPITGKRDFHEGLDIAAPLGTPVKAALPGKVTHVGWTGGYGRLVVVSHDNGIETRYGHLSEYAVEVGRRVSIGDTLGYAGQSGNATGPHCHFEIRIWDVPKNPIDYLPEVTTTD